MKILSAIISSIWNTITFMDKEQRALVAHVLTVSQAHPKSFSHQGGGDWQSKGLKISYDKTAKTVKLSNVIYQLGWRANAILARHFAMLHICLHHEHIGKALSEIDKVENEQLPHMLAHKDPVEPVKSSSIITNFKREFEGCDVVKKMTQEPIDLSKYIGKICHVELSDGRVGNCFVDYLARFDAVFLFDGENGFNKFGHCGELSVVSIREIAEEKPKQPKKEKQPEWVTDIDLTKWIGKTVDVKMRDGKVRVAAYIGGCSDLHYNVRVAGTMYTQEGRLYSRGKDERDIVAIKPST